MTERFECPYTRPSEEKPCGLKMGEAAHEVVSLGVKDARKNLRIDSLEASRSDTNPDPTKGWRDGLLAISIDHIYRNAHPQIKDWISNSPTKVQANREEIFRTGRKVVSTTRSIFTESIYKSIEDICTSSWVNDVYRELDLEALKGRSTSKNGKDLIQNGAETLFTTYDFLLAYILRQKPNASVEEVIENMERSLKSFVYPMTTVHINDSFLIGDQIYQFAPDVRGYLVNPLGLNDNQLIVKNNTTYHSQSTIDAVRQAQRKAPLQSVVDGCPALLSPRVTQPRYPNSPLPPYRNAIQGLYSQMNEQLKKAV